MLTSEEKAILASQCIEICQPWQEAAMVLLTGGDEDVTDLVEVARLLEVTRDDADVIIRAMIRETID